MNQEVRAVFPVGAAHLVETNTFQHTAGNLGGTLTVVSVLLAPCVDQGIHLSRGPHAVDALHNPQTSCWVFDQPAHLEVFQQGLGVVLCLTVQAHRVELAKAVTHGTVKLLAQAMLDCGRSIRNLSAELDAVAWLGWRHAGLEPGDHAFEACLLLRVQWPHAINQGLGVVGHGEHLLIGSGGWVYACPALALHGSIGHHANLLWRQVVQTKLGAQCFVDCSGD